MPILLKKILRIIRNILLTLLAIILILGTVGFYIGYRKNWDLQESLTLSCLMNAALGLPYHTKKYLRADLISSTKLPEDEWWDTMCKISKSDKTPLIGLSNEGNKILTTEQKWHLNCLSTIPDLLIDTRKYSITIPNPENAICKDYRGCQIIAIGVKDYVLQKPEILDKMIMIAERPCDYIKTRKEMEEEGAFKGLDYTEGDLDSVMEDLQCGLSTGSIFPWRKDKIFVVITILGSNGRPDIDIIVRRKDLD